MDYLISTMYYAYDVALLAETLETLVAIVLLDLLDYCLT